MDILNKLLDEYKSNYVQFITTGIQEYKTAYQNALSAVDEHIDNKRKQLDKERKDMKHFASAYKQDNDDLKNIESASNGMLETAQSIQDKYVTARDRYDLYTKEPPSNVVDYKNGYNILLRVGIILIVVPVLFFIGYFVPELYGTSATGTTAQLIQSIGSPRLTPFQSPRSL